MSDAKPTPEQKRAAREWCQANPGPLLSYHYGEPNDDELDRLSADYEMQEASLARLLAEREAAVRGEGWVSVGERLPEPGVHVLACFRNEYGKSRRVRAEYSDGKSLPCSDEWADGDWGVYSEEEDEYFAPEGWFESNEFEEIHWQIHGVVTHWMPLPAPPPGGPDDD